MISRPLAWMEPVEAAGRLRPLGGLSFLDSAARHPDLGRWSIVAADPFGRLEVEDGRVSWNGARMDASPLDALRGSLSRWALPQGVAGPPFQGGAIGILGYEFARHLEHLSLCPEAPFGGVPEASLGFYDVVLAFDHDRREALAISSGLPETEPERRRDRAQGRLAAVMEAIERPLGGEKRAAASIGRDEWRSNFSRGSFVEAVGRVVEAVLAGEIFQANIAQRFLADLPDGFDPWVFYQGLRRVNPAPFAAYLDLGARIVASSSPEMFLALRGRNVETRPIKGTARRSRDPAEDRAVAARLLGSQKDRAENLMIVDLLRNDLSRVCEPHSVETPRLCDLETHAGVHHLVSRVTGRLRKGLDAVDLLAAGFPGGSVTGAPKLQAMEVIARIERERRGLFCGSVAAFGFDGSLASSIAIRTVLIQNGRAIVHAGGGITALSDPEAEYRETLDKAERIFLAFEGGGGPPA